MGLLDRVRVWVDNKSAASESDSTEDGVFSYAAEWHAFTHGVYLGFTTKPRVTPPEPDNKDVDAEPHYYRGGYVIGSLVQVALAAAGLAAGAAIV